jgi:cysteine desulfurase/selenocysteine lyase
LVYFDSGATSQKPQSVIDAIVDYYSNFNSNIHRGVHTLSQEATEHYEAARTYVQKYIAASASDEIIFTRGTTESINLVANGIGETIIQENDEILISAMEHHSNILPWQEVCNRKNAKLKVIPINQNGELILDTFHQLLTSKTKFIALTHVSNTLGTINPIKEIIKIAHAKDIQVLIDGAQAIPHLKVDVQNFDCDYYVFSGHKVYAPTGIGVLFGKKNLLNKLPVYQSGGGTIKSVSFDKTEYAESPLKFEAGTPNIEGAIGLAAALQYIEKIGITTICKHEERLLHYATNELKKIEGLTIYGNAKEKAGVLSFNLHNIHPFDVGTLLDKQGIAVRTGHHCTQPLMQFYGIPGTIRVSFAAYNSISEIDLLTEGIKKAKKMLS